MEATKTAEILVVGLGNPILGDDGVGWRAAEALRASLTMPGVEVDCLALGGLSLMERLVGYRRAIIIDAIQTQNGRPGQIHQFPLSALPAPATGHSTAVHDVSLQTALRLGQAMGAPLPEEIQVVAIEAEQVYDFSEELTTAVAAAIPEAVQTVLALLEEMVS